MLGPNRRPALIVGGTRVLLSELACCRVRWDNASRAARPDSAALRLSSELTAHACRQLAYLHGVGNWCPMCHCREACASVWRHVCADRILVGGENYSCKQAVCQRRGGNSSCEAETPCARRRLLVRGCKTWVPLGPHRPGSRSSPTSGSGLLEDPPTCLWAQPT
jgi:hypothetical protein